MNAVYLNPEKKVLPIVMGCYGIGVSRIVAAAVEQNHDGNGILWSRALAPYEAVVISVEMDDAQVVDTARRIYEELNALGIETLWDDRDERAGVKFKDADLIGIPLRIVAGKRHLTGGQVELKLRNASTAQIVPAVDVVKAAQTLLSQYRF